MDLVQVDVVDAQAPQARVAALDDVLTRQPHVVDVSPLPRPFAHRATHLRRDHDALARRTGVLERLAEDLLGFAFGVDIGAVEEIHASIERGTDESVGLLLPDHPYDAEVVAERHRPHA